MADTKPVTAAEEYVPEVREPAGYRLSDADIREQIHRRLAQEDGLDVSGIAIDVQNGEVTLRGHVRQCVDMQRVEQLAGETEGVRLVRNGLVLDQPPSEAVDGDKPVGAAPKMGKPGYEF
jgi:osmotically-inducible protein OsmY